MTHDKQLLSHPSVPNVKPQPSPYEAYMPCGERRGGEGPRTTHALAGTHASVIGACVLVLGDGSAPSDSINPRR